MCPLLPTFVQESTVRGIGVLVSVSVAHFGVILLEDRVSHPGEGSDVSFFPRPILQQLRGKVLHILSDLSFTFMTSHLSFGWYHA
jgi:hypothetical protein